MVLSQWSGNHADPGGIPGACPRLLLPFLASVAMLLSETLWHGSQQCLDLMLPPVLCQDPSKWDEEATTGARQAAGQA